MLALFCLSACQTAQLKTTVANEPASETAIATATPEVDHTNNDSETAMVEDMAIKLVVEPLSDNTATSDMAPPMGEEPYQSAQAIAQNISNDNYLNWSELDSEASTDAAAKLLAEAQRKPKSDALPKVNAIPTPEVPPVLDLWQLTVANYGLEFRKRPHYPALQLVQQT